MLCLQDPVVLIVHCVTRIGLIPLGTWHMGILIRRLRILSRPTVVGWHMLYVVKRGPPLCPPSTRVSPFVAAAPLVFRSFISTTIANLEDDTATPSRALFKSLASLLWMTPTIARLGPKSLKILLFIVPL